jgi:hypothetical protein
MNEHTNKSELKARRINDWEKWQKRHVIRTIFYRNDKPVLFSTEDILDEESHNLYVCWTRKLQTLLCLNNPFNILYLVPLNMFQFSAYLKGIAKLLSGARRSRRTLFWMQISNFARPNINSKQAQDVLDTKYCSDRNNIPILQSIVKWENKKI